MVRPLSCTRSCQQRRVSRCRASPRSVCTRLQARSPAAIRVEILATRQLPPAERTPSEDEEAHSLAGLHTHSQARSDARVDTRHCDAPLGSRPRSLPGAASPTPAAAASASCSRRLGPGVRAADGADRHRRGSMEAARSMYCGATREIPVAWSSQASHDRGSQSRISAQSSCSDRTSSWLRRGATEMIQPEYKQVHR
jgi:hypothetical protein